MTVEPPQREVRSIVTVIDDIYENRDRDYNTRVLVKRLQRIDKEMSGEARGMFRAFIREGDVRSFAMSIPRILQEDFSGTMAILKNEKFRDLLVNYPRPQRSIIVTYQPDTVASQWLIHDSEGRELAPEDYLTLFTRFVRENPEHIEAIGILLDRPRDWSTDALIELKTKLSSSKEHFTVETLRKAHEIAYKRALVDIISMVKHAARAEEPLLTAEERVDRSVQKIFANHSFSIEQQQWMERIRAHLIENLSISKSDFDSIPIFSNDGGWKRANRVFSGDLPALLQQWNEAIAA